MWKPISRGILGAGFLLVAGSASAVAQEQCFECINCGDTYQCCVQGSWGEVCSYYYYQGFRYCSTSGPGNCGDGDPGLPGGELALSPAGTYIASIGSALVDGRHVCTGFVVSFQSDGGEPGSQASEQSWRQDSQQRPELVHVAKAGKALVI